MIEGVIGYPGAGKSLYGVKRLLEARADGRRCFANFTSARGLWGRVVWENVRTLTNAFVVLDEAHMWFPARQYTQTTQNELAVFQQHRKAGLDLLWVAQADRRIDVALRELTVYLHYVRRVGPVCIVITMDGIGGRKLRSRMFLAPRLFKEYFTEERVLGRDEVVDTPLVGIEPNYARYVDEFGHVRIVRRDEEDVPVPSSVLPAGAYYRSPWGSGSFVEYPAAASGARPLGVLKIGHNLTNTKESTKLVANGKR